MRTTYNFISGTLLAGISYLLGGFDLTLKILLIMMGLDYFTGILKSIYNKKLSSKIGAKGIIKKVLYLVVVAVAVLIDKIAGDTGAIRSIIIYFFVSNEGISILENCAEMDLPIPKQLIDILDQLKKEKEVK